MNRLAQDTSWETIEEYLILIESLPDPWGRTGFYAVRTGRWLKYHSCHIEFSLEIEDGKYTVKTVANSYLENTLKVNITEAINQFIEWYDKSSI